MSSVTNKINIAIDGLSGCGKSTLAKSIANQCGYIYIDSGAMYRAITWYFLKEGIASEDHSSILSHLDLIELSFRRVNSENVLFLNGCPLLDEIRTMNVSQNVSQFSVISPIRRKLVDIQQEMAKDKGVVMDGRDIGTVVLPDADLKLFITCDIDVRTMRRKKELEEKQIFTTFETIRANLIERDRIDSTRNDSPLRQADDAILIDNTHLSESEQFEKVMTLIDTITHSG